MTDKFYLIAPERDRKTQTPLVRVPDSTYDALWKLHRDTGLALGNIAAQCISYALDNMAAVKQED